VSVLEPVSYEHALAWVEGSTRRLDSEEVALDLAAGRVLAADLFAPGAIPPADCAALDGFAVRAADSLGAGAYNPLAVDAIAVEAGESIPPQMDSILPLGRADPGEVGRVVLVEPVVVGANVDRRGTVAAGGLLVAAGCRLSPAHLGIIAIAGFVGVPVTRRPQVRLVIAGRARSGQPFDSNGPMLRALIERDGGVVVEAVIDDAFGAGADIILVAGGSGYGREDRSPAKLADAGSLDIHGVALVPGETAGFGHAADGAAVILLPGTPAACFWNYEVFAGRAIRRLGGHDSELPYRSCKATAARKIVSLIGMTEICPVRRLADGRIEPVASFAEAGMMAAVAADGFVIVPAASEGYPAGAAVNAYFYEAYRTRAEPFL
jgi:molybdopterin molybdotransferase